MIVSKQGTDGVRTRDLRFTRPTPYHLATAPDKCAYFWLPSIPFFPWILFFYGRDYKEEKKYGSGGIRTHASEETGALNQRLRPLGHATSPPLRASKVFYKHSFWLSKCQSRIQGLPSRSLWRNRLARSAVNRKVGGSSPPRDGYILSLYSPEHPTKFSNCLLTDTPCILQNVTTRDRFPSDTSLGAN